jgi:aspartyl protease family protein
MTSLMTCLMVMMAADVGAASLEIEVVGLFKDTAVVSINGQQRMLRVAQTSPEGVHLVSADSEKAVISIDGESRTLYLSTKVSGGFKPREEESVSIQRNNAGQYVVGGTINDRAVRFLVDTGANIVALNSVQAGRLGLNLESGKRVQTTTASGVVTSYQVVLNSVQVGGIRMINVPAAVLPGNHPTDILLGMTFLEGVVMREEQGVMVLTSKY